MKVKQDFVTNSSTTSFIISLPRTVTSRSLFKIVELERFEVYRAIKSIKTLIAFVQQDKHDWINEIRGPKRFYYFNQEKYDKYKKYLQDNSTRYLVYTSINRDDQKRISNVEKFVRMIDGIILEKDFG